MDPEDPDSDPDHSQNLITSSFYQFGHILKILSKSNHLFLAPLRPFAENVITIHP